MTVITRSKGSEVERQVDVLTCDIPDLRPISELLESEDAEAILDVWSLCHDLIRHIEEKEEIHKEVMAVLDRIVNPK